MNDILNNIGIAQDIGQQIANFGNIFEGGSGIDVGSLIDQLQNNSVVNQSALNQDLTDILNSLQKNPDLLNQIKDLLGLDGINVDTSSGSIALDQLVEQASNAFGVNLDLNSLSNLLSGLEVLLNKTTDKDFSITDFPSLIQTLETMGVNTSDVYSLLEFFNMFMNDTQLLQAFIESFPTTYGELK